ncbi:sensor histidine kinase [Actinopolymorpha alba]|uniref:sensor histidine kinase n=1 Tax=Actinopolymorpha alba TaxID=533267 RepID=UPI00039D329F|nr:histidine kinase [Actinopolymorpha alba]
MVDGLPPRIGAFLRGVRGSWLLLRFLFLLIGSALVLSFLSVDLAVADALWDHEPVILSRLVVVLVALVPPTLLGMLPQLRHIEGAAAASLLGVDFKGQAPGLTRGWDQRWRTVVWFWTHLFAGGLTGCVVMGWVLIMERLVRSVDAPGEGSFLGLSWATDGDVWVVAALTFAGLFLLLVGLLLLLGCGEVLVRIAPVLLGPSIAELLAELESRTTDLVERTRLARELHDSVGHALSIVVLHTAVARRRLPPNAAQADGSLAIVEDVARRALEDLDVVLGMLREPQPATRHPAHDLRSLDELVRASRAGGQPVDLESLVTDLTKVPAVVSREAYRIVQEGLTNALRHAPDQPVHVRLAPVAEGLQVHVANPLGQRAPVVSEARGGRGLVGARERVRALGGRIQVGTENGRWVLDARLPLPEKGIR